MQHCWISLLHLHMYCIIAWANPRRMLTWWASSLLYHSVGLIKFLHFIKPILKAHGNFQLFLSSWKRWTFSTGCFCICATRNKSNALLYSSLSLAAICFLLYPFPPFLSSAQTLFDLKLPLPDSLCVTLFCSNTNVL